MSSLSSYPRPGLPFSLAWYYQVIAIMTMERPKTIARKTLEHRNSEAKVTSPEEQEEQGPTIQELLHDSAESQMFAQFIDTKTKGAPETIEFMARLREGNITEKDLGLAEKYRSEYLALKEHVARMDETIDSRLAELRNNSDKFDSACTMFGGENYASILKQGLLQHALTRPTDFKRIEKQLEAVATSEKAIDDPENVVNKRLGELQRKFNVSDETMLTLTSEQDPAKRAAEIQKIYRSQMGLLRSIWDHARNGSRHDAQALSFDIGQQQQGLDAHTALIAKAGGALAALVSKNLELRSALMKMKPDQEPKLENGVDTTLSFTEAQNQSVKASEVHDAWQTFLGRRNLTNSFSSLPTAGKDGFRDRFIQEYANEKVGSHHGLWAKVLLWLLTNKLKTDPKLKAQLN